MKSRIPFDTIYIETMEQKDMIVKNKNALKEPVHPTCHRKDFFCSQQIIYSYRENIRHHYGCDVNKEDLPVIYRTAT